MEQYSDRCVQILKDALKINSTTNYSVDVQFNGNGYFEVRIYPDKEQKGESVWKSASLDTSNADEALDEIYNALGSIIETGVLTVAEEQD